MRARLSHHPKRAWPGCLVLAALLGAASHLYAQSGSSVSILPLGDSLTWGLETVSAYYPEVTDAGGYRTELYSALKAQGVTVTFDGVDNGDPSTILTEAGQTAHDGFSSYTITDLSENLSGSYQAPNTAPNDGGYWLSGGSNNQKPDIILLQIGANDLLQSYDPLFTGTYGTESSDQLASDTATRLGNLINKIIKLEPQAMLLVDGTPPLENGAFYTDASQDYETDVANIINTQFRQNGKDVFYVDMAFGLSHGPDPGYSYYDDDGIHLDFPGYNQMGDVWAQAVINHYFDGATDPADPVPEPSTYALLPAGRWHCSPGASSAG